MRKASDFLAEFPPPLLKTACVPVAGSRGQACTQHFSTHAEALRQARSHQGTQACRRWHSCPSTGREGINLQKHTCPSHCHCPSLSITQAVGRPASKGSQELRCGEMGVCVCGGGFFREQHAIQAWGLQSLYGKISLRHRLRSLSMFALHTHVYLSWWDILWCIRSKNMILSLISSCCLHLFICSIIYLYFVCLVCLYVMYHGCV